MPEHVHVIAELQEGWNLPKVMNTFKSFTARGINEYRVLPVSVRKPWRAAFFFGTELFFGVTQGE
jgi:REP element-mobilizing transposase RayT